MWGSSHSETALFNYENPVLLHPSILKNSFKSLRFSRAKQAGGFAADLGRFGETTLPFFRLALTEQRTPVFLRAFVPSREILSSVSAEVGGGVLTLP